MKLASLLEHHFASVKNQPQSNIGSRSLGDAYLSQKNHFYKVIREKTLAAGFSFSSKQDDAYRALALSQLDRILEEKTIPYIDNVTVLEALEKKIPKQTDWDDIVDNLKGNHVFHESCHAVAKQLMPRGKEALAETRILRMLLEESFANTVELLSIVDANDQVHRVFLELNSYVYMLDDRASLQNAIKELGRPVVVRFMMVAYLFANFLRAVSEAEFDRVFAIASPSALDVKQKKTLRALSKIAFKLNPRFREVTTAFHLKLHGLGGANALSSLSKFDFLAVLSGPSPERSFLDKSAELFESN